MIKGETMEHVDLARALLNQASMMAYEAYGRYFAVNSPWGRE